MRSHGRNSRQPRGGKGREEDQYMTTRAEEPPSDSYSRSHHSSHHSEGYRMTSGSNRMPYESSRDITTSQGRHEDDWRRSDSVRDRYSYRDAYERDDYDLQVSRESDGWRSSSEAHYSQPRADWPQRYDHENSSYHEGSTWDAGKPHYETNRSSYYNWPPMDSRDSPHDTRQEVGHGEKYIEREASGWRPEQRRERSGQKFQSDSGWDSRRREKVPWNEGAWDDPTRTVQARTEERSWEPAASWKSGRHEQLTYRAQNGQRSGQSKYTKGGKKKSQGLNKPARDWRSDDSALNNWTKRENYTSPRKPGNQSIRRKHARSPSRSRSQSPVDSYRSHMSSRGRSRSRSYSPASKRRRRDSSSLAIRSRSPNDRGRTNVASRFRGEREHSISPLSPAWSTESYPVRRKSFSSTSSVSTNRSRSRSPSTHARAVHRLPTISAPSISPTATSRTPLVSNRATPKPYRNGKHQANGKHYNGDRRRLNIADHSPGTVPMPMPPPSVIPSSHHSWPAQNTNNFGTSTLYNSESSSNMTSSKTTRIVTSKNAGFKPIGKASSALKKFFPGDDDDADIGSDDHVTPFTGNISAFGPSEPWPTTSERGRDNCNDHRPKTLERDEKIATRWDTESVRSRESSSGSRGGDIRPQDNVHHRLLAQSRHVAEVQPLKPTKKTPPADDTISIRPSEKLAPESRHVTPPYNIPIVQAPSPQETREREEPNFAFDLPTPSGSSKDLYSIVSQVGEGTFGKVYKARNTITNIHVALKRIRMETEKDGFPVTAMREIKLLQSLRHENVVRLYEMMVSNGSVYMVFEYMDHDLTGVLSQTQFNFTEAHLKSLCHQMLAGLAYLHHKGVIHRDIKGSNILINNRGELKLADFGLARFYHKRRRTDYTNRVITLWYRPPELLFGATVYGPEVDMWSAGCIMLELFTKKPVFQGNDEIHQLDVVYKIIGTPTPERWAGVVHLPWFELVKPREAIPNHFRELFQKWMSPAALDLAEQLLAYDPGQRVTALQAMSAPYFTQEAPSPAPPVGLASLEGEWHELETKRERAKRRRRTETTG